MESACTAEKLPVLKAYDIVKKEYLLYQPRCKMWKCPACANTNRLLWMAKIGHGYEFYNNGGIDGWAMLTITTSAKLKTFEQCLFPWKNQWSMFSSRMRRKYKGFRYVLLPECHSDGRVHWHLMASGNIKTRWMKDNAPYCGLGFMQQAKKIKETSAAIGYVSKYISKAMYEIAWPPKLRRIVTSQKWPILPPEETFETLEVNWQYYLTYPTEGIDYLAYEIERETGVRTRVLSPQNGHA
jgi:hypothetical protein